MVDDWPVGIGCAMSGDKRPQTSERTVTTPSTMADADGVEDWVVSVTVDVMKLS